MPFNLGRIFGQKKKPAPEAAPPPVAPDAYFQGLTNWTKVESSNLHSVAYLPESPHTGELRVRFKDVKTGLARSEYRFEHVPPSTVQGLLSANSHGVYFSRYIRYNPAYPFAEVWSFKAF